MISKSFVVMGVVTLLSVVAYAGSAPKELYGKSITVQWSESITGRKGGGQTTQNWLRAYLMNIYVSSAGRPFVRLTEGGTGGAEKRFGGMGAGNPSFFTTPGGSSTNPTDHVDFQGRSIVVYREFQSDARRIAIDLDGNGAGCNAGVINGRQSGKSIVQQQAGRGEVEASSIQIASVSCSVRDGNVFAQ
jgi:hypothetical protein